MSLTFRPFLLAALAAVLPLLLAPSALAQGEIIVVDDVPDVVDFPAPRTVAQLPGPDGRVTFREAIIAANNTPGPQTIHFNVPRDRWPTLYSDRVVLWVGIADGHAITDDGLTIDGTSQTAFTGDTNPNGNEVAFWGQDPNGLGTALLYVYSDHNTFRGLDNVHQRGQAIVLMAGAEHNRIVGNTIDGTNYGAVLVAGSHNTVGGTAPGEGNRLVGLSVAPLFGSPAPTGNRIVGNHLRGVVIGGAAGTVLGGPTPEERNVIAGAGSRNGEGCPRGTQVTVNGSTDTIVEGNYVGLTADGMAAAPGLGPTGILVRDAIGTVVRDNAIGGIRVLGLFHCAGELYGWGVEVDGASDGTLLAGNRVGTRADGTGAVPNLNGIRVGPETGSSPVPTNTTIGGTAPGEGNVVARNERLGIVVKPQATGVAVLGNAVFQNGQLGLDLGEDGPTANDAGDADEGANRRQNHPVIQSATLSGATLTVTYAVDTAPAHATYPLRVEFFRADADGEEGAVFLGADTYTESDYQNGQPGPKVAPLDVSGLGLSTGDLVLGTATDAAGNTSEFGLTVAVGGAAAVTVGVEPVGGPVVIGPSGGSFTYRVTLTNTTTQPQSFQAWTAVTGPVGREPVVGPQAITLPPGATAVKTLTQRVPGNAPAGAYTYHVRLGAFPVGVTASASFPFTKQGSALAGRNGADEDTGWAVSGWDDASSSASASLPDGFVLSEVYPNPATGTARLTLEVAEAQAIRAEVYDALGRRVAVLLDGAAEAGVHALVLDGSALPAGVYVVRVTGETLAATRRLTLVR